MSAEPVTSKSQSPRRRKVTFACDTCRQRRAKCSGTQPCTFCQGTNRECKFDDKTRARRGPKPRQPPTEPANIPRELPLIAAKPAEIQPVSYAPAIADAASPIRRTPKLIQPSSENPALESQGDDGYDAGVWSEDGDDDHDSAGWPPDVTEWSSGLTACLNQETLVPNPLQNETSFALIQHLLELYWPYASAELSCVIPCRDLFDRIKSGTCPRCLVFAICACMVRFSTHKAVQEPSVEAFAQQLVSHARHEEVLLDKSKNLLELVCTYCYLIEFGMSWGLGSDAWVDIGTARRLLQLASSNHALLSSYQDLIRHAEHYLSITEACFSLCGPGAPGGLDQGLILLLPLTVDYSTISQSDYSGHLLSLVKTLVEIHRFSETPSSHHRSQPWDLNSSFKGFQDRLENYLIRHPTIYGYGVRSSQDTSTEGLIEPLVCALLWNCCVMSLNRIFLPVSTGGGGEPISDSALEKGEFYFPGAPRLFLEECINRCEGSAATAMALSKEIISSHGFFPCLRWLGFSCMQTSLILVGRLGHHSSNAHRMPEALKSNLGFLYLVGDFFSPANDWADTMQQILDTTTDSQSRQFTMENLFDRFFNRFAGIQEPNFISLDQPKRRHRSKSIHSTAPYNLPQSQLRPAGNLTTLTTSPVAANRAWASDYAGFLDSGMTPEGDQQTPSAAAADINVGAVEVRHFPNHHAVYDEDALGVQSDFLFNVGPMAAASTDGLSFGDFDFETAIMLDMMSQTNADGESSLHQL